MSQPSLCIAKAIREYVIDGTVRIVGTRVDPFFSDFSQQLPAEGAVCQPDEGITFPPQKRSDADYAGEDKVVIQALINLSQVGVESG